MIKEEGIVNRLIMKIYLTVLNKEIQINMIDLEIEVQVNSEGGIENITVDGQKPSEIESMIINDNMYEIQEEIDYQQHEAQRHK